MFFRCMCNMFAAHAGLYKQRFFARAGLHKQILLHVQLHVRLRAHQPLTNEVLRVVSLT